MAKSTVQFKALIQKFGQAGEKTGWTHIVVPATIAQQLLPGNKKSFRVKGSLDNFNIEGVALLPMGGGDFVMALNASMRKGIWKRNGSTLDVRLQIDTKPVELPSVFLECLKDDPEALEYFSSLPKGHQNYFGKWIDSAKTEQTRTKRIAQAITALSRGFGFSEMVRNIKNERKDMLR